MYYQYSRIGYGMSYFLDIKKVIDDVERFSIKYTKSILGLPNQTSSRWINSSVEPSSRETYVMVVT